MNGKTGIALGRLCRQPFPCNFRNECQQGFDIMYITLYNVFIQMV